MKAIPFQILPTDLLDIYKSKISATELMKSFDSLQEAELTTAEFSFYTSVASVYSSKIEGEDIDLDAYIKHKRLGVAFNPDYTKKIDDLYQAYQFAQAQIPNRGNIAQAHIILTKHILSANWQGRFRQQNMFVTTEDGRIEYVAAMPEIVGAEMEKLFADMELLLSADLDMVECFFFASLLHLVFVKIHPWNDGNGRSARLLEKWFLAQKLGTKVWFLQTEKYYYDQHNTYYHNVRLLGIEYPDLDYTQALPFLLMAAKSVIDFR